MERDPSPLFIPVRIRQLELNNRIVMAPMTRGMSPGGAPGPDVARYYAKRASGGAGLIITEGTAIDHSAAQGYPDIPHIYGRKALNGWKAVVDAVHAAGSRIFCQLWHVGGYRKPGFDPQGQIPSVAPSAVIHPGYGDDKPDRPPKELTTYEIEETIASFVRGARNAQAAGFDGVEIHGAHGYLIDQFFWQKTNLREDAYGGPLENRIRFAKELVASMRAAVRPEFIIGFRFSQWKLRAYTDRIAETSTALEAWLKPLSKAGVDLFHASTYQLNRPEFPGSPVILAGWTKRITGKPVIAVGQVGMDTDFAAEKQGANAGNRLDLAPLLDRLAREEFDLVAVGRALIGDPNWPLKVRAGRTGEIRPYHRSLLDRLD